MAGDIGPIREIADRLDGPSKAAVEVNSQPFINQMTEADLDGM
jgi:hypothetical protein